MKNFEHSLTVFRHVLCQSWDQVESLLEQTTDDLISSIGDWAQSNWEMIVEASVQEGDGVFLLHYWEGSDCNGKSSRVWHPKADLTHCVVFHPKDESGVLFDVLKGESVPIPSHGILLYGFVSMKDGWHFHKPPFDHVLFEGRGGESAVFRVSDVRFDLAPFTKESFSELGLAPD
jgi:hypothetical protein